jgi:nitrite reductase/ring-hydroxylating ferredoxin subunit
MLMSINLEPDAVVFSEALAADQLPPGRGRTVRIRGVAVALFNVDGAVHAVEDSCLHAGGSLGAGRLNGRTVACPAHGWRFDVTTGALAGCAGVGVATYPVKVEDGAILVAVGAPQPPR